ncbi:hypothetical protein ACT7DH_04810 [Bacillus pacificus]
MQIERKSNLTEAAIEKKAEKLARNFSGITIFLMYFIRIGVFEPLENYYELLQVDPNIGASELKEVN